MTISAAQRYALIAQIARDYNEVSGRVAGKKVLQKLMYVLHRRVKDANLYNFSFYNYGVFSSELARDISEAERYSFIDVGYDEFTNTFSIKPSDFYEANKEFLPAFYNSEFGADLFRHNAKDLELITTIMFVCDEEGLSDKSSISKRVRELKPKFSETEIECYLIPEFCSSAKRV